MLLYSYRKVTDDYTTYELLAPDAAEDAARVQELATIDGVTYVVVPDGVELPLQPGNVIKTLKVVALDADLRSRLLEASPQLKLTAARMVGSKIQVRYSKRDEAQLNCLADFFNAPALSVHVADWRAWDKNVKSLQQF